MPWIKHLLALIRTLIADRARLTMENVALRQQIIVLQRSVTRAKIDDSDRIFWMLPRRSLKDWKDALIFVKPDTVLRRRAFPSAVDC